MIKEIPILFSPPMVEAIMEGRKTQTRRILKPQPPSWCTEFGKTAFTPERHLSGRGESPEGYGEKFIKLKYGQPGDILWVRETWKLATPYGPEDYYFGYKAHDNPLIKVSAKFDYKSPDIFFPSIHMPKEACRNFLNVKHVRIERLQAITRQDALAEGIIENVELEDTPHEKTYYQYKFGGEKFNSAVEAFAALWIDINGFYSWDGNPWVTVTEFERITRP